MLLIELFSGTGSVGKVARRRGWKVISVDNDPAHQPTYVADVLRLPYKTLPVPDFVWASPPCTTYSYAAHWVHHREPGTGRALSGDAKQADRIVRHTMKMIRYWLTQNPNLRFCIENPRGYLRKLPEMRGLERTTTQYSFYGFPIRKTTDFWTNFPLKLKTEGAEATVRIGDPGYLRTLRDTLGAHGESQAVLLGRIPSGLVSSILTQMSQGKKTHRTRSKRQGTSPRHMTAPKSSQ